jgi:hypothetical protein
LDAAHLTLDPAQTPVQFGPDVVVELHRPRRRKRRGPPAGAPAGRSAH